MDDARFVIERHVGHVTCPSPGDETALLDLAASLLLRPLPLDRPLWTATLVTGLDHARAALVIVVQHALTDGIGGLAVLDALLDGAPAPARRPFPVPPPSPARLTVDAVLGRARALRAFPARIPAVIASLRLRRGPRVGRAAPCSLMRPTGPRRRTTVARTRLDEVRAAAHQHGATVNDVVLTAVGGALHATLEGRGEHLAGIVVGVPVAERARATARTPGNRFRETRAVVTDGGDPLRRLERVARTMRDRKAAVMSPTASAVAAVCVRTAVAAGVYDRYLRRQRYLHTVVTNVHGPDHHRTLLGAPVTEIVPLAVGGGGNVTVTFAALSYAGALTIAVTADPDRMPDLAATTAALQEQLDALTTRAAPRPHEPDGPDRVRPGTGPSPLLRRPSHDAS